jgi:hypothetical protein
MLINLLYCDARQCDDLYQGKTVQLEQRGTINIG